MFCPHCGKENPYGSAFCMNCGAKLPERVIDTKARGEEVSGEVPVETVSSDKMPQEAGPGNGIPETGEGDKADEAAGSYPGHVPPEVITGQLPTDIPGYTATELPGQKTTPAASHQAASASGFGGKTFPKGGVVPPGPPSGTQGPLPPSGAGSPGAPPPAEMPPTMSSYPAPGQPRKRRALPWILGLVGVAVIAAVVVILVLFVFGAKSDVKAVEDTARKFYRSLEKKDFAMLMDCIEPSYREELEDALGKDIKTIFEKYFFTQFPKDLKIEIRAMETVINGNQATVRVTDGTVTYTDESGKKVTEEASNSDVEEIQMVKVNSKWYVAGDFFRDSGLDPEELKSLYDLLKGMGESRGEEEGAGKEGNGTGGKPRTEAEELALLEKLMLDYAKKNSTPGYQFVITSLMIDENGTEAVGICTTVGQGYESFPILARKGTAGWYCYNMGTGIDIPTWYQAEMSELWEVLDEYTEKNTAPGSKLDVSQVYIWGREGVGLAVNINGELAAYVLAYRSEAGWRANSIGDETIMPRWLREKMYYLSE